jgi:hypothetical protein
VAEGAGLLNQYTGNRIEGSNPSPSANVIILREIERRGQLAVELDFERAALA